MHSRTKVLPLRRKKLPFFMQPGTAPDDVDAFKQTPELDSCRALQLDWTSKRCEIFRSRKKKFNGTTSDDETR